MNLYDRKPIFVDVIKGDKKNLYVGHGHEIDIEFTPEAFQKVFRSIKSKILVELYRQNLSIYDLAQMSSLDYSALYRIIKGSRNIGFKAALQVCYALGINLDDIYKIYEDDDNKRKIEDAMSGLSDENFDKIINIINMIKPYDEDRTKRKISIKIEHKPVIYCA